MMYDYIADVNAEDVTELIPNPEAEFFNAKSFLQKASTDTHDNLYDHLTEVLNKILAERPENIIDFFEEYCRKVKEQRYRPQTDHIEDMYISPASFDLASKMLKTLKPLEAPGPSTADPEDLEYADMSKNNLLEMTFYMEQAGLSLPREEMVYMMLSMRRMAAEMPITTIKLWGKIFGTVKNYLIIETELREEAYVERNEKAAKEEEMQIMDAGKLASTNEMDDTLGRVAKIQDEALEGEDVKKSKVPRPKPNIPQVLYEEPKEPPSELSGAGLNKKVYFVSTDVGGPWTELPDVTPQQVRVARQICKSFTGNLENGVYVYPEFPGKEKNYLRAQIARISSATNIAPLGYYTFGGEGVPGEGEEEEEEFGEEAPIGESKLSFKLNTRYEPPALKDLLDPSMSFWVHTAPYILPQGRATWWNPTPKGDEDEEDVGEEFGEEEEDEEKKAPKAEPETGPPLLTPLSEDASLETTNPWTIRSSSKIIDMYPLAIVRSNLWPGGYAISTTGKIFFNIYLGSGLKYMQHNFSPLPLPYVQQEYPIGPEILEVKDPSGMEEEQWRIDHLPKPKIEPAELGEEQEPEEEVAEEEDEDED